MSHDDQLQNKLYRNWVRSSLGLKYLQEGLHSFVDTQAQIQHDKFLQLAPNIASVQKNIHCSRCMDCQNEHNNINCETNAVIHTSEPSHIHCKSCNLASCLKCNTMYCTHCNQVSGSDIKKCNRCTWVQCLTCTNLYCSTCAQVKDFQSAKFNRDHCVDIKNTHSSRCEIELCNSCSNEYCKHCSQLASAICRCSVKTILPDHFSQDCHHATKRLCNCQKPQTRTPCQNKVCGSLYDLLIKYHVWNNPIWTNTDPAHWKSSYWEVAKCFLSSEGYEDTTSAATMDASGLLSICINSIVIAQSIDTIDNFREARENRNVLLHSHSFEISDIDASKYIDKMIAVLSDKTMLLNDTNATKAVSNLVKLQNDEIQITSNDVARVKTTALQAIDQLITEKTKEIENVSFKEIKRLESELDQLSATDKKHREDIGAYFQKINDDNRKKNNEIDTKLEAMDKKIDGVEAVAKDVEAKSNRYTDEKITQLKEDVVQMLKCLQQASTYPQAEKVTGTAKVTTLINNVSPDQEKKISEAVVIRTNDIVNGRELSKDCTFTPALKHGLGQLESGQKTVVEAQHGCITFTIQYESLASLVSLCEDCLSGRMTTFLKPLEDVLRTTYDCQNLELEVIMYRDDFWESVELALGKLKAVDKVMEEHPNKTGDIRSAASQELLKDDVYMDATTWQNEFEIKNINTSPMYLADENVLKQSLVLDDTICGPQPKESKKEDDMPDSTLIKTYKEEKKAIDVAGQYMQDRLRNPEYENWIKCTLGMTETKKCLDIYVKERFTQFAEGKISNANHENFMASFLQQEREHQREEPFGEYAKLKTDKTTKQKMWIFDMAKVKDATKCTCKDMFDKITTIKGRNVQDKDLSWKNCMDIGELYWDVAKVFMYEVKDQNKDSKGPGDIDMPSMCNILLNCDLFTKAIPRAQTKEIREARKQLYHSPGNTIDDAKCQSYFKSMTLILDKIRGDPEATSVTRDELNKGFDSLQKLEDSELGVNIFEEAAKALQQKQKAIHNDFHDMITAAELDREELKKFIKLFENDYARWNALKDANETEKQHAAMVQQLQTNHTDELKNMNEQLEELRRKHTHLEDDNKALHETKETLETEINQLRSKTKKLERKNADLECKNKTLENDKKMLHETNETLEDEINNLLSKYKVLESKNADLKCKNIDLNDQFKILKSTKDVLERKNQALDDQNEILKSKIKELISETEPLKTENKSLIENATVLEYQVEMMTCRAKALEDARRELENKNSILANENKLLETRIRKLQSENKTFKSGN